MNKIDEVLVNFENDIRSGRSYGKCILEAKQALAKLFHEAVPEKKQILDINDVPTNVQEYARVKERKTGYNQALDQTHKNVDKMFNTNNY